MQLADLIESQNGIVARWQARTLGMPADTIDYRLRHSIWWSVYPGIYAAFTGPLLPSARWWAAILLCSKEVILTRADRPTLLEPDAALSHETAAFLHGLIDTEPEVIHVTIPSARRMPVIGPEIKLHMSIRMDETRHPTLSPPRTRLVPTVIDLTQTARTSDGAISWLTRACGKRLATPERLHEAISTRKKLRRRPELVEALMDVSVGDHSLLERRFHLNVERAHGLPEGRRQRHRLVRGGSIYEDVVYEVFDVSVELDGHLGHEYEGAFRDRKRDNATAERGGVPLRYGHTDVTDHPCATALQIVAVLRLRGWTGQPTPCNRPGCVVTRLAA